jgi:hypothetical protein
MRVLIGCEFSGVVRDEFAKKGHDAWSCDILPTESEGNHYQMDIFDLLEETSGDWDLAIFHPTCKFLANSGSKWLYNSGKKENGRDEQRWENMYAGADFFARLKNADIPKLCLENPIPHCYASNLMGKYSQTIQPWQFGHPETKRTCLWLKNLPLLKETENVKSVMKDMPKKDTDRIHYMGGKDRGKNRSVTFKGIAKAMANQWG